MLEIDELSTANGSATPVAAWTTNGPDSMESNRGRICGAATGVVVAAFVAGALSDPRLEGLLLVFTLTIVGLLLADVVDC